MYLRGPVIGVLGTARRRLRAGKDGAVVAATTAPVTTAYAAAVSVAATLAVDAAMVLPMVAPCVAVAIATAAFPADLAAVASSVGAASASHAMSVRWLPFAQTKDSYAKLGGWILRLILMFLRGGDRRYYRPGIFSLDLHLRYGYEGVENERGRAEGRLGAHRREGP